MSTYSSGRVMIIGLDGATLDLIRPWADAGLLPTFKRLMEQGTYGRLRSTMPPITPAAWSSFITGVNPGKHGIFDFTGHRQEEYNVYLVRSTDRKSPSLWQLASQAGKRVIVYNVPVTYPPERVNGLFVSGLLTPSGATDASYPPELQQELQAAVPGLSISPHGSFRRGREVEFVSEMIKIHDNNMRAAQYLMERQPWDLFVMVFQNTDTLAHFMWKHMKNERGDAPPAVPSGMANALQDCYVDIDAKLARLIEKAGSNTHIIVMSDHGHGKMDSYFAINTWLLAKGYIRLKSDPWTRFKHLLFRLGLTPSLAYGLALKLGIGDKIRRASDERVITTKRRLKAAFLSFQDIDWSRTLAYSNGYCGPIFVNLKGREPHGTIASGEEYEELLERLTADLRELTDATGQPFVADIYRGHELYSGPYVERGADLLFSPCDWNHMSLGTFEFNSNRWFISGADKTGHHRMDGIFFLAGPGIRQGYELRGASIIDVTPTALALLGVPIPESMEGRVLETAMVPGIGEQLRISYTGGNGLVPELQPAVEMSAEDEDIIIGRLRDLGYLG